MDMDKVREQLRRLLVIAGTVASLTPTLEDDRAVALFGHIVNDDILFAGLKDLLSRNPPPAA